MKFPVHACELTLTHNPHTSYYQTVAGWLKDESTYEPDGHWISDVERDRAVATDEVWELHWYPRTPIGFYVLRASTLEALLEAANALDTTK